MNDAEYNSQVEKLAELIVKDGISLVEQDKWKLKKYHDIAKKQFKLENRLALQLVNEAFLYLKLKDSDSIDLLQHGDQFGAGFS